MDQQIEARAELAREVALEAGALLREFWRKGIAYERKGTVDLVSAADKASEDHIRGRIVERFPYDRLLLEEAGKQDEGGRFRWIVDPLDGTTNFVHGHPVFAVSVAVELDGEVVAGVVHAPISSTTYAARRGAGATVDGGAASVSGVGNVREALVATGFPYDRHERADDFWPQLKAVIESAQGVRRCGAAALDLCSVGCGRLDIYYEEGIRPWDLAAGRLFVEEAGGEVTRIDGSERGLDAPDILATNGRLHRAASELLTGAQA